MKPNGPTTRMNFIQTNYAQKQLNQHKLTYTQHGNVPNRYSIYLATKSQIPSSYSAFASKVGANKSSHSAQPFDSAHINEIAKEKEKTSQNQPKSTKSTAKTAKTSSNKTNTEKEQKTHGKFEEKPQNDQSAYASSMDAWTQSAYSSGVSDIPPPPPQFKTELQKDNERIESIEKKNIKEEIGELFDKNRSESQRNRPHVANPSDDPVYTSEYSSFHSLNPTLLHKPRDISSHKITPYSRTDVEEHREINLKARDRSNERVATRHSIRGEEVEPRVIRASNQESKFAEQEGSRETFIGIDFDQNKFDDHLRANDEEMIEEEKIEEKIDLETVAVAIDENENNHITSQFDNAVREGFDFERVEAQPALQTTVLGVELPFVDHLYADQSSAIHSSSHRSSSNQSSADQSSSSRSSADQSSADQSSADQSSTGRSSADQSSSNRSSADQSSSSRSSANQSSSSRSSADQSSADQSSTGRSSAGHHQMNLKDKEKEAKKAKDKEEKEREKMEKKMARDAKKEEKKAKEREEKEAKRARREEKEREEREIRENEEIRDIDEKEDRRMKERVENEHSDSKKLTVSNPNSENNIMGQASS